MPEVTRPPLIPFWATRHYLHAYPNCSVRMKPTKSKEYMLSSIVINQMGKCSQVLFSRQRAPPSVYRSASGIRAPPHVGKSRVKESIAALGRRPWVGARQGRRPGRRQASPPGRHGVPLHWGCGRVDMGRRYVWEAPLIRQ